MTHQPHWLWPALLPVFALLFIVFAERTHDAEQPRALSTCTCDRK